MRSLMAVARDNNFVIKYQKFDWGVDVHQACVGADTSKQASFRARRVFGGKSFSSESEGSDIERQRKRREEGEGGERGGGGGGRGNGSLITLAM